MDGLFQPRVFFRGDREEFPGLKGGTTGLELEGRRYEMAKNGNHIGPFVSLKVTDASEKNFFIFVPKGGRKGEGWREMVDLLCELGVKTCSEMQKRRVTKVGEEKRNPRQMPFLGVEDTTTGRSLSETPQ